MQVVLKSSSATVLGVRNIVAITGNSRIFFQFDFHKRLDFITGGRKCAEEEMFLLMVE